MPDTELQPLIKLDGVTKVFLTDEVETHALSNINAQIGKGEYVAIPRLDWGVGMAEKTIRTGLCPGGRLRMERLIRLLQTGRVDPARMTTHTFEFGALDRAFEVMDKKLDGVLKPLIVF